MPNINYTKGWKRLFILCSVVWFIFNVYQYPTVFFISNSAVEAEIKVLLEKEALTKVNKNEELIVEFKSEIDYKKKPNICAYGTKRGVLEVTKKWEVVNEKISANDVCIFDTLEVINAYEAAENRVLEVREKEAIKDFIKTALLPILLGYLLFIAIFWVIRGFINKVN